MIKNMDQFGYPGLEVKGITIHNTGRRESARELFNELKNSQVNQGCHFLIDETETIQMLPLDWCAYHTGKGKDWGNNHTIAIEICRSQNTSDLYFASQVRAIRKIKKLMNEYNLTTSDIYFHNDFSPRTYCPHKILETYGNKKNFIKGVNL